MTDFEKFCAVFVLVVGIVLTGGIAYKIGHKIGYRDGFDAALAQAVPDTVWHTDTVTIDKPVPVVEYKDRLVYIPITDSVLIHHHDTTYIALQFEKKEYSDSTYRAIVSGFQPSLDFIETYQKTAYITNTVTVRKRWSWSVAAGPGVMYNGKLHAGVGIVAGVGYNF